MRCLVTAGKHVNNTRAIARHLHDEFPRQRKRLQRPRYCWTITMETVFPMWFVPKCNKQSQSSSAVKSWQLAVEGIHKSSAREAVTRPGRGKLKKLHC
jgi:hypothetical protein